jgi:hypothetical protein
MALAGDHLQVLVGGYELTGDHNRIVPDDSFMMQDITAFGDAVHNFIPGIRKASQEHAGYMNKDAGRSHPVLNGISVNGVVSILVGQNAAPVVGDPAYMWDVKQYKYGVSPEVGKYIPFGARFVPKGNKGGWGRVLTPPVTITTTTTGSGVDDGAQSTNGGAGYLHVLQVPGSDTYSVTVEHATQSNFSDASTLLTFTLNGSQLGSERIAVTGTVKQYLRYKATRLTGTGSSFKLAVGFVRF